jgi:hypothetical protein
MKVYNGTPHDIKIVEGAKFVSTIRKYVGGEVVKTIKSNGMLSAKIESVQLPSIDGIPVYGKTFSGVDALPEGYDVYIVSALYASAAKGQGVDVSKLYTVSDPVYTDETGNSFLGCLGIAPIF